MTMDQKTIDEGALLASSGPYQLTRITPDQLTWLTPDQLSRLTPDQLTWLTHCQLSGFTPDQLSGLTPWDSVPTVEGLYGKIAADIDAEQRFIKQSTFGPQTENINTCQSPMCVAGHTVHLGGHAGYELARKFGWGSAAWMIHTKSCPGVAAPRYDSYPDWQAEAYIRKRAQEEAATT